MGEEIAGAFAVRVACLAGRADASHRSEMVTQWLCGEPLTALEEADDWIRCRGPDGYEAWCTRGGLVELSPGSTWTREATARSLGCRARPVDLPDLRFWLPFGAWLVPVSDGSFRLADGSAVRAEEPEAIVRAEERRARFPAHADRVVATVRRWLGVPYLWGGRTMMGADCSGMVQAVFGLHGVPLPRDSAPQSRAGDRIETNGELPECREADLLFFGEGGRVTHVAVSTGGSGILHAADANGAVKEDDLAEEAPLSRRLRGRLLGVRRPLPSGPPEERC